MASNLKQLLAPNQLFALAAKGIEGTKVIAINIAVARYYGPEVFGQFAFALGIVSLVAIVGEFKLVNILIQRISTDHDNAGKILGSALGTNLIFSGAGILLLVIGGLLGFYDGMVFLTIFVLSLGYIYKIPRAFKAFFIVNERTHLITVSEFFSALICLLMIGFAIYYDESVVIVSMLKGFDFLFVSILLFYFYWCQKERQAIKFSVRESTDLIKSGLPLAVSGFVMILFQRVDIFMIKFYLGDESVGFYTAATNYMMLFTLPGMVLTETLSPRLFRDHRPAARREFLKLFFRVGLLLSLTMLATSYYVIPAVFGHEYDASVMPAFVLSSAPFLICLGASAGQLIIKDGLQKHAIKKSLIACGVNIILNAYAIPRYGNVGAAASTVISFFYAYYFGHFFVRPLRALFKEQTRAFIK